jgi:hypothetical protein
MEQALELAETAPIAQASNAYRGMGNGASDLDEFKPLIAGHFSDLGQGVVDGMTCIIRLESGGNRFAWNTRSTASGLGQVMFSIWGPEFGLSKREELDSAELNLYISRQIWERQGWAAWPNTSRKCGLR